MTKEPQEECKHLWDCKEYNPKCHICGKLMRDDSFYDEDDHCNHAWEEGKLYCMYCGKSRETFTPMTPQEETYQTLENKALAEYSPREPEDIMLEMETFMSGFKKQNKKFVLMYWEEFEDFLKSHLQLAYKAGEEKGRDSVPSITGIEITYPDVRQQAIAEERETIKTKIEDAIRSSENLIFIQHELEGNAYIHLKDHCRSILRYLQELQNK